MSDTSVVTGGDDAETQASGAKIDVAQLIGAYRQVGGNIQKSMQDYDASLGDARTAMEAQQRATIAAADAQNEVMRIDAASKLEVQRNNARAATALGVNPNSANYLIESMGASILNKQKTLEQKDMEIQQKLDLGFFQDPLQWVSNQFTVGMDVASYNNLLSGMDQQQSVLKDLMSRSSEAAQVNAAIQETETETKVNAAAKFNLAAAAEKVATSEYNLSKLNMDAANVRVNMSRDQFTTLLNINNALAQRETLDISKRREDRQDEENRLNQEYRQATLAISQENLLLARDRAELDKINKEELIRTRQEAAQGRAILQSKLNNVTTTFGMNPIAVAEYYQLSPATRQFLETAMMDPDIERGRMAGSVGQALNLTTQLNVPLTAGMRVVQGKLQNWKNTNSSADPTYFSLDAKEKVMKDDTYIKTQLQDELKNIPDSTGVYSAPPLAATLTLPGVQKWSPTIAAQLAPLAQQDAQYSTKSQQVFDTGLRLVMEGKLSPAGAALEISNIYSNIMMDNNAQRGYRRWNIPVMSETTTGYKTNIYLGFGAAGAFSQSRVLNMSNPAELEAAITRTVLARTNPRDLPPSFEQRK